MSRASLNASTALPSGLIDTAGASIPSTRAAVDIRNLPLVAEDALPPLPKGIEARLLGTLDDGVWPTIILWSPVHEVGAEVPLQSQEHVPAVAAKLVQAIAHAVRSAH